MSSRILGETFDIHGGGLDLVFPHHENEIAQSECRFGKPMARYWLHNGLMQASDEVGKVGGRQTRAAEGDLQSQSVGKISKSKGASAFRDLLQQFAPENIRFFLLSSHYRRPIDYSEERIREVGTGMEAFYRFFKRYQRVTGESFYDLKAAARRDQGEFDPQGDTLLQEAAERRKRFLDAMDDDFNTGGAIAELFELMRRLNKFVEDEKLEAPAKRDLAKLAALRQGATTFREMALTLGLFRTPPPEKTAGGDNEMVGKLMQLLIEVRAEARKTKNFAMADQIRKRLSEMGITLEDRPGGTDWTLG
jgi:cysteinyl-tRNA synthetase